MGNPRHRPRRAIHRLNHLNLECGPGPSARIEDAKQDRNRREISAGDSRRQRQIKWGSTAPFRDRANPRSGSLRTEPPPNGIVATGTARLPRATMLQPAAKSGLQIFPPKQRQSRYRANCCHRARIQPRPSRHPVPPQGPFRPNPFRRRPAGPNRRPTRAT